MSATHWRIRKAWFAAVILSLVCAFHLHAQPAPIERVPVLIGFQQMPGAAEQALVRALGGEIRFTYTLVPALAATIPPAAIEALRRNPRVTVVEPDVQVFALADTIPWGISHIHADDVQAGGNTGSGVKVCVIDSGMQLSHPDLSLNYAGGWDFVNNDALPDDDNGHGTHVAGTIAALSNGSGVVGAAPGARLYIYKMLDANGSGSFSAAIAALDACAAVGGQITNNSYGSSVDPGTIVKAAFDEAYARGILNVAAAGNSGKPNGLGNTIGYPARYASVMAVAAVDSNDIRPTWSSYGDELEISAPGVTILSTYFNSEYAKMSGTSMASPHVAGVAALVAAGCGLADPAQIRQRLTGTAKDLGAAGWDKYYGDGLVQADLAANCTAPDPIKDLAVLSVSAPSSVTQGTNVPVQVVVKNTGTGAASNSVTLTDNDVFVGTLDVPALSAGSSDTLTFNWTASSTGERTLKASLVSGDDNSDNDAASATVNVVPPSSSAIVLTATAYKVKGRQKADLSWSGANATDVDVFRNAAKIATTANDGSYTDNIDKVGGGSYTYKVCEAGTTTCSNEATVVF